MAEDMIEAIRSELRWLRAGRLDVGQYDDIHVQDRGDGMASLKGSSRGPDFLFIGPVEKILVRLRELPDAPDRRGSDRSFTPGVSNCASGDPLPSSALTSRQPSAARVLGRVLLSRHHAHDAQLATVARPDDLASSGPRLASRFFGTMEPQPESAYSFSVPVVCRLRFPSFRPDPDDAFVVGKKLQALAGGIHPQPRFPD
jgi:hypothetical protein